LAHQIFRFFGILGCSVFDARAIKSTTVITALYRTALAQIAQEKYSIFSIVDAFSTEHWIGLATDLAVIFARQAHID
jgi:hypothetical protein